MKKKFKHLVFNLPKLDPEDLRIARAFYREMRRSFDKRNVEDTPLLTLRMQDVLSSYLLLRRLETAALNGEPDTAE